MKDDFLTSGGDSHDKLPAFGPQPCTMLRLAKISIIEGSPGAELHTILTRSTQQLCDMHPEVLRQSFIDELWAKFNRQEGRAFMIGTAPNEPSGIFKASIDTTPVVQLTSDKIINQVYAVSVKNRMSSTFLCHPNTKRDLKRLTDGDGRFLFQSSLTACDPDRLMGYPVEEDPDAPENELLFGNFSEGYHIYLYPWVSILRDPFGQKPNVLFFCTRKVGGFVEDTDCFQKITWE